MFEVKYGFDTFINGTPCLSLGLITTKRPNIPTAEEKTTVYELKGRDGSLYSHSATFQDITIQEDFQFLTDARGFHNKARELRRFFRGCTTLSFSDDPEWFYKIKHVTISDIQRNPQPGYGTLSVKFTAEPYAYSLEGMAKITPKQYEVETYYATPLQIMKKMTSEIELLNSYDTALPLIEIQTPGTYTLTLNDSRITFTTEDPACIDIPRGLIYSTDVTGSKKNIRIEGDALESFCLVKGKNTLKIVKGYINITSTEDFPIVSIRPGWRCLQ